ncbi:MAG TPA: hypothetical protein VHR45_02715 [Thermoanaerobaculia bacterium]|nr:hypothetical protein [Thermoanaerobaculia bacterium]
MKSIKPMEPEPIVASPAATTDSELAAALQPGVILVREEGTVAFADPRALSLLRCASAGELDNCWEELRGRLEPQGIRLAPGRPGPTAAGRAELELGEAAEGGRRLALHAFRNGAGGAVLLVYDTQVTEALETDLRLAAQMRSLSQVSPAVAHDLRAPINAMVLNLEVLHESLAAGKGAEAAGRERQLRYVDILRRELARLHQELEVFLAHTAPRAERSEVLDLRQLVRELAALLVPPARKQQIAVTTVLPDEEVPVEAQRYPLRQALLHFGLAALARVPREGRIELRLERAAGRALLRIAAAIPTPPTPGAETAAEGEAAAARQGAAPAGLELRFSAAGSEAQLYVARSILAAQRGDARLGSGPAGDHPEAAPSFELELPLS